MYNKTSYAHNVISASITLERHRMNIKTKLCETYNLEYGIVRNEQSNKQAL